MIKVAVVILNWNGEKFLEKFLQNVVDCSKLPGCQVYVVDNNSTDNSISFIQNNFSGKVEILQFNKNYGFALGYQKALQTIKAEYHVLLNSDVEVTPGWIQPIIDLMDADKTIGAVTPKIKAQGNKNYFEYAGAAGGFIDKFGFPFCQGRILYRIERDMGQYQQVKDIFWASGAAMFVRATAYFEAGGLDGDFFAHMEEIDLCWRMKHLGYRVVYCPQSEIYHVGGGTLPNNSPRKLYLNYRNSLYLLYKNLPDNKFHRTLLARMVIDFMTAIVYLLRFEFSFFDAVGRSHRHFLSSIKQLRPKRAALKKKIKKPDVGQIYKRSIILSFYLKRKHFFSQLSPKLFTGN